MSSFIDETIDTLHTTFGDDISNINILLPSKRARLFFNNALSLRLKDKPLWQPNFMSVDNMMQSVSGIMPCDKLRLITELYKVYSKFHNDSFDKFYYWGEVLLSDFDMIDNYMVDAKKLFVNISDLKDIDNTFDFLDEQQAAIVKRFWNSFNIKNGTGSAQQKRFLNIWNTLYDIYAEYNTRLKECGFGYKGFIYRQAAERIKKGETTDIFKNDDVFAVIGFNALSSCEKILLRHIKNCCRSMFFWDNDIYYMKDRSMEAGLFMRDNVREFGDDSKFIDKDNYSKDKNITIIDSPSDSLQCKYVWQFLNDLQKKAIAENNTIGKQTAVVLTNEQLLIPVLYSIPKDIDNFNVTSGYPLKLTSAYTLIEYLLQLQHNIITDTNKEIQFYHKDVIGVLSHPYIYSVCNNTQQSIINEVFNHIESTQQPFVNRDLFTKDEFISSVFRLCPDYKQLSEYLISILDAVITHKRDNKEDRQQQDYLYKSLKTIINTTNIVTSCSIDINTSTYISFLRKHLQSINISFEGDPLMGVQIMGILETRNIDFDNVLILSLNEDNFPGTLKDSSFIPANLRKGYSLPIPSYQEAMYSYYFYRLLQRAKNIDIVYCSKSDEMSIGEPSRFIQQLKLESKHTVKYKSIDINVNIENKKEVLIDKTGIVYEKLEEYIQSKRKLSPSALFKYIQCPYAFYLRYIEDIKEPISISDDIDVSTFGSIMHETLEDIYRNGLKATDTRQVLELYADNKKINAIIDNKIFARTNIADDQYSGLISSSRYFISNYIRNIIQYDIQKEAFSLESIEFKFDSSVRITVDNKPVDIGFYGIIDRIDAMPDGSFRLIDYKSGSSQKSIGSIESIFNIDTKDKPKIALFQILLYSMLYSKRYNRKTVPALYFAKDMNSNDYNSTVSIGKQDIEDFSTIALEFEQHLVQKMEELFNKETPFYRNCNENVCKYCPYSSVCI